MGLAISVKSKIPDARAVVRKKKLEKEGFSGKIDSLEIVEVYSLDVDVGVNGQLFQEPSQLEMLHTVIMNPVTQKSDEVSMQPPERFDWAIEIGYLPGVTDNVAATVKEGLEDLFKVGIGGEQRVYTAQISFVSGSLSREDAVRVGESLANPLIQNITVKSYEEFVKNPLPEIPRVRLHGSRKVDLVDLLNTGDEELTVIGKEGIANSDGSRRGPLALDLTYMKAIQAHFRDKGRNPTDVEVEALAQTWSEHCKHTIFADPLDEIVEGLYEKFIKGATKRIRAQRRDDDFCVSVFTDNSGAIMFDERHLVTHKVETHNSPSALDPFGGAITGIVGVNRDALGFGLGAKPIINTYGFCFGNPDDLEPIYKDAERKKRMLPPRRMLEGVVDGVKVGGNCSGIPTPQGFVYFDERYKGKPLVFVGTVGLIPRESAGRPSQMKAAQLGDYVVMVGGRVGQDGIHGATFSSEALSHGSPASAVQIGDPITQKKMSDALVKEARALGLYSSITDNGAGGLSCSVAEMAKESGGCLVELDKVPLKYPGLQPWQIWISESQERMTLAVPQEKWKEFHDLMKRRGVESAIIGEFTDSERCVVQYKEETVMDVDMNFLHEGLPQRSMKAKYTEIIHEKPLIPQLEDLTSSLHAMLSRPNIASFAFISEQYDHEVQGGSVLKPLQGRGRVNGDATVTRPVLDSKKGVVLSQGIFPSYSDIYTQDMAGAAIDTAIRNALAVGARLERIALLDNFCWCSSNEPERLGQLKEAARGCYEYAVAYGTPFISGKDSMFNDFNGFDNEGKPIKISIPPTLLISSLGIVDDIEKVVSLDAKSPGDLVYLIGNPLYEWMGGSEYFAMVGEATRGKRYIGNKTAQISVEKNKEVYTAFSECIEESIVASAQSVHRGGMIVALAKTAMGGKLGMEVSLRDVPGEYQRDDYSLYSETPGRLVVTVHPRHRQRFGRIMGANFYVPIGQILPHTNFRVFGRGGEKVVDTDVEEMLKSYRLRFEDY